MIQVLRNQLTRVTLPLSDKNYTPLTTYYMEIEVDYNKVIIPMNLITMDDKKSTFEIKQIPPQARGRRDFLLFKVDEELNKYVISCGVLNINDEL